MSEDQFNEENTDGMDNTTAMSHILDSGDIEEVRTLLGDRDQVRHAGIIRGGIKVPKKSCSKEEVAKFHELEQQGLPYDLIDEKIGGKPRSAGSKLFPQNADFLVIRACDFKRPSDADFILKNYADPDGRVRRLPIWLASSDIDKVLPHSFRGFDSAGRLRTVSYYKNGVHTCRFVPKDVKIPHKDDWKERPCDPDNCTAVAEKKCQFGGIFKVQVPGLRTMGPVIIPTRSWNGIKFSCGLMNTVRGLLGRCDGLFQGEPFLELVKSEELVNTPEGKRKQFIITIELSIDSMELARYAEPQAVASRSLHALKSITGGAAVAPLPVSFPVAPPTTITPPTEPAAAAPPQSGTSSVTAAPDAAVTKALHYIADLSSHYGLNHDHVRVYAIGLAGGVAMEDQSVEELRALAADLHTRAKEDPAKLAWDLQGAADAKTGTDGR